MYLKEGFIMTEEKKISKVKVGLCAMLGYAAFNSIRNILFAIVSVLISGLSGKFFRYRLEEIAFFVTMYVGYIACGWIGEKILKTESGVRRYMGTVGILFIINYAYYIVDYFRHGEGRLFYLISSLFIGILLYFSNRKEEEVKK